GYDFRVLQSEVRQKEDAVPLGGRLRITQAAIQVLLSHPRRDVGEHNAAQGGAESVDAADVESNGPERRSPDGLAHGIPFLETKSLVTYAPNLKQAEASLFPLEELPAGCQWITVARLLQVGLHRVPGVARQSVPDKLLPAPVIEFW